MNTQNKKTWWEKFGTPISILIGVLMTIRGWMISDSQKRKNDLRDIRNSYISSAYKDISNFSTLARFKLASREDFLKFERALKEIQLYGSKDEIRLVHELIQNFADPKRMTDFDPLLNLLRQNLRGEFELEEVAGNTFWIMDTSYYKK